MAEEQLLCGVQYIKDNTTIDDNVDDQLIRPFISKAQDVNIESIIGTKLMKKLKSDLANNTLTGNYKILVDDYIMKTLREWTMYYSLPHLNYKITNKSVSKKGSENSSPSEMGEIIQLQKQIRDIAEYYSQRLTNYIITNPTLFPEYFTNSKLDEIQPNSTSYDCGIFLDDTNYRDCRTKPFKTYE